ncbi:TPA: molecular chaperone [Salmonella enterica subsp. enterica serovar Virchow]|nr:molecular chaperone [Salmonella enterica]
MDKTRLIYKERTPSMQITNNKDYPVLVRTGVWDENNKKSEHFISTPPFFKMDPSDKNIIKVINIKKGLPTDRESLNWLCVENIPPTEKNTGIKREKRTENISISVRGCIKLIYRPAAINDPDFTEVSKDISWRRGNGKITVSNSSPYYISFGTVKFDNTPVPEVLYVKPFSTESFQSNARNVSEVSWNMINDIGGTTAMQNTKVQ